MNIALIEPYYGGSHKHWADSLQTHSKNRIDLYTMPPRHWKWRMQGSAYHLAEKINESGRQHDLFLVSDMTDLALLKTLINKPAAFILYMHENQLCYPFSQLDKQKDIDLSYGYLNYKSCLAADWVLFNSKYHLSVFIEAINALLNRMPDYSILDSLAEMRKKCSVLYPGIEFDNLHYVKQKTSSSPFTILWNHRWDMDKNPEQFASLLEVLRSRDIPYQLILTAHPGTRSTTYEKLLTREKDRISHHGYVSNKQDYYKLIAEADLLPVPDGYDYFGISVLEAVGSGVTPLLPAGRVYDEHFSLSKFGEIYYDGEEDYINKTIDYFNQGWKANIPELIKSVEEYDINNIIEFYDELFRKVYRMSSY